MKISVRALVERFLRSGDLVIDVWDSTHPIAAIRAHQKIQKSRPPEYTAEVPIAIELDRQGCHLEIGGRIDGVYRDSDRVIIEEIKTTRQDLSEMKERDNIRHWGQSQVYSHLYNLCFDIVPVETHLTYYQLDSRKALTLKRCFEASELEVFFNALIDRYILQEQQLGRWATLRNDSIISAGFPFGAFRKGQREMAVAVYRTLRDGKQLLAQAPTGIGKTMAVLFPALKALAEGSTEGLLYLTARNTGRITASETFRTFREKGIHIRHLELTAKDKICFNPEKACNGEDCGFARGYYDRVDAAIDQLLEVEALNRETIETIAQKNTVCPFELSLEGTLIADAVVGDYNYAFDPRVTLRRLLLEENRQFTFLIDEAHNLVDRSREMFSAEIEKSQFLGLRRQLRKQLPGLARKLSAINTQLLKIQRTLEGSETTITQTSQPDHLLPSLRKFIHAAEPWLPFKASREFPFREALRELVFTVNRFLRVADEYNETYSTIYTRGGKDLKIRLFCTDASPQLNAALRQARSTVLFSATLSPAQYFTQVLGLEEESDKVRLPSPFPPENLCLLIANSVATTYARRESTVDDVARNIAAFVEARTGNYLLFFPSYEYLNMVETSLNRDFPHLEMLAQSPAMDETERAIFLEAFQQSSDHSVIGLAVMGGIFGEGIDLVGECLTGAVIVSVGLPAICAERQLIREYFDRQETSGFDFSYTYPGFNRVLQAAGRVIRSEHDRGVVLLIDERFGSYRYRSLFPREWKPVHVRGPEQLKAVVQRFWKSHTMAERFP
ncbi:MAG: ATP-dependent DNA helicase [Acidobacteriota bacterium]|nr:MAG: ATP-dependent DNA helicase [Acidobacteriota bacterium]